MNNISTTMNTSEANETKTPKYNNSVEKENSNNEKKEQELQMIIKRSLPIVRYIGVYNFNAPIFTRIYNAISNVKYIIGMAIQNRKSVIENIFYTVSIFETMEIIYELCEAIRCMKICAEINDVTIDNFVGYKQLIKYKGKWMKIFESIAKSDKKYSDGLIGLFETNWNIVYIKKNY